MAFDRGRVLGEFEKIDSNLLGVKRSDIVYKHMRDPALLRYYYRIKTMPVTDRLEISGSSPTDIFIGRFNYPNVYIGPMLPPEFGDTSILATPERWRSMSIEDIVSMRSKLVRGMYLSKADHVEKGKFEEQVRDLALAEKPAEAEVDFKKKPFVALTMKDEVQPFGPSAIMRGMEVYNIKPDKRIERSYSDVDAKAATSVVELYERGVPVSKIEQAFSAGLLGLQHNRRFVPTRWSITAVDDTISKDSLVDVKSYQWIDTIYAYYHVSLDNRWLIFFLPGNWEYESMEAWYPNTVWNENGTDISIYSSYEGYFGRKKYAEIGGCYYAARLAVTEKLKMLEKQSKVLILREVHEGYLMPVGVWNVREHVRETLGERPVALHGLGEMFDYIKGKMDIKIQDWVVNSRMLKDLVSQRRIYDYVSPK